MFLNIKVTSKKTLIVFLFDKNTQDNSIKRKFSILYYQARCKQPSPKKTDTFTPMICKVYKVFTPFNYKNYHTKPTLQLQSCKVTNRLIILVLEKSYFVTLQAQKEEIILIISVLYRTLQTLQVLIFRKTCVFS